jgi:hypothetical protein
MKIPDDKIDFDEWMVLARSDPDEFERRRRILIEKTISRASARSQPRLRCLQWRIDMERQRARTPLAACLRLSSMMWDSVVGESGLLHALDAFRRGSLSELAARAPAATIMVFPRHPPPRDSCS